MRNSDGTVSQPLNLDWCAALYKLADYEDAEESGRLFIIPCKIGDEVFIPWAWNGDKDISAVRVEDMKILPDGDIRYRVDLGSDDDGYAEEYSTFSKDDVGIKVFLNRDDAKNYLEVMK